MEETESLCKIKTKDGDFYLFTRWLDENWSEFELSMTDGCSIWEAKVNKDVLESMAQKVEMNIAEYKSQTFNALSAKNSEKDTFIYQAVQQEAIIELNWKKLLDDGVKFQLGSISMNLSKENKILMKKILDFSIKKIHEYKGTITNLKCETEQLAQDRENAILRLDKSIAGKEEMEIDLFQKFVTVLNDKKAKIRRLQETIEQQSKEPRVFDLESSANVAHTSDAKTDETRDDDTDVETEDSPRKDFSKQTGTTSSNIDSCLFQDEEDTAPVTKRRRKQPARKPVRTPSKPVLPEVKTSVKRTTSNASSTSTNSNESNYSGSDAATRRPRRKKTSATTFPDDVEDLFGDMA